MRSKLTKFAIGASIMLAMVFTFSCSSGDDGGGNAQLSSSSANSGDKSSSSVVSSSSSVVPSSSSAGVSSSSSTPSSSSSVVQSSSSLAVASDCDVEYINIGGCDISGYKTVIIGSQVWMAENLNCDVAGSKCYDNNPANCEKYGRLYNWNTANTVCPSGWHLPSHAEWGALMQHVNPSCSPTTSFPFCDNAGTKLKATSGWCSSGNGTDDYGFSALPGGVGNSSGNFNGGNFVGVGSSGRWWASEYELYSGYYAYRWNMASSSESLGSGFDAKVDLFSVRCVQD